MNEFVQEKNEVDITFFVPCRDEENNIIGAIENIIAAVSDFKYSFEILVFDDNSIDKTFELIESYMKEHQDVPITLKKNEVSMGFGHNFIEGAFIGRGKYYKIVAGKNDETKDSIIEILKELGTVDIVIPYFKDDPRDYFRRNLSGLFTRIVSFLSGYSLKYYNSSALHLRSNVMRWCPRSSGNGFHAELLTLLLNAGATYKEVPIKVIARKNRSSKVFSFLNFLSVTHSLINIFIYRIRKILYNTKSK